MFEIGESLAAARRAQSLTLADVESLTCIRQRNLAALESERFDQLPGRAYSRAFLRTYASALGLDADRFVAEFERRYPEPVVDDVPIVLARRRRRAVPKRPVVVVGALAALAGFVAWSGSSNKGSLPPLAPPSAASAARPAHVVLAARPVTPKPARPQTLVIRAVSGDCWVLVRLRGATGPVLYEATLRHGQSLRFGPAKVWVRFGAPWNVDVRRGGKPVHGLPTAARTPLNLLA